MGSQKRHYVELPILLECQGQRQQYVKKRLDRPRRSLAESVGKRFGGVVVESGVQLSKAKAGSRHSMHKYQYPNIRFWGVASPLGIGIRAG